jgi:hypothetical protein
MKTAFALLVLVAPGLPSIAQAETETGEQPRATYSFDIGSHVRWFGDTSAAIVSTEELAGVRMTVGRSLTQAAILHRDVEVGLFGRWVYAGVGGTMFGDLDSRIGQHLLGGGARLEAPLRRWLSVNAQGELGMSRTSLTVSREEMTPVDDHKWAPYGAASLGIELTVPYRGRTVASLGFDVGYLVTVPVELRALPGDRPDEQLSIDTSFASVGKLDTRGFTYAASLRGRF